MRRRTAVLGGGVVAGVAALGLAGGLAIAGGSHSKNPHGLVATHLPTTTYTSSGHAQAAPVVGATAGGSVPSPETAAARGGTSSAPGGGAGDAGSARSSSQPSTASGSSTGGTTASSSSSVSPLPTGANHGSSTASVPPASSSPPSSGSSGGDASSGSPAGSGDGNGDHAAPVTVSDPDGSQVPAGGTPVVFTATLTPPSGLPSPTGSMIFTVYQASSGGQQTACTVAVHSASATCPVSFPTAGRYEVAAFYVPGSGSGGRSTYVPSQGAVAVTAGSGASTS